MKQKAVIFDLGNVLVGVDYGLSIPLFVQYLSRPLSHKKLEAVLYGSYTKANQWGEYEEHPIYKEYHRGKVTTKAFYEAIISQLPFKNSLTLEVFSDLWPDKFFRIEETIDILKQLKFHKRYLLSDTNELDADFEKKQHPDIFAEFDKLYLSYERGILKDEIRAWEEIFQISGLAPKEHIFIDDRQDHVRRARSLGMQGIKFTNTIQLQKDLRLMGYL